MLAVDLDNGQLRISVSQGERKVFQKTLRSSKSSLADGAFHHVMIYKREKVIHVSQGVIGHIFRFFIFYFFIFFRFSHLIFWNKVSQQSLIQKCQKKYQFFIFDYFFYFSTIQFLRLLCKKELSSLNVEENFRNPSKYMRQ